MSGIALIYETVVWSSVAAVFGFILMRQLTIYPGKHSISYILPCLLFSYSVVAGMMFLLRTDYSSYVIIASFVTVLIWLHSMQMRFHFIFIAMRCGLDFQDGQVMQGNVGQVDAATVKHQVYFYYIKNFSPWLDLLIVLKTVQTMLSGFGSR